MHFELVFKAQLDVSGCDFHSLAASSCFPLQVLGPRKSEAKSYVVSQARLRRLSLTNSGSSGLFTPIGARGNASGMLPTD